MDDSDKQSKVNKIYPSTDCDDAKPKAAHPMTDDDLMNDHDAMKEKTNLKKQFDAVSSDQKKPLPVEN